MKQTITIWKQYDWLNRIYHVINKLLESIAEFNKIIWHREIYNIYKNRNVPEVHFYVAAQTKDILKK